MLEARELSYYPIEEVEINKKTRKVNKTNRRSRKSKTIKKKSNSGIKIMFLFLPVMIASICLLILFRYVNITSVRQDLTKLQSQKTELEKTKINLIGDLEGIKSSKKIAEDAILKLGMDYPSQDQIVYVSVNNNVPVKEARTSNNRLKRILSMVGSMF